MTKSASYEELKQRVESLENQITKFKQNEVSLKESEKRFRILLDFAPYPVATFTLKGNISYLNPSFTEVFGWTLDDMKKGKALFVPPELVHETSDKLKELFKQKTVIRYVTKRCAKNGKILDVIVRGVVFSELEMGVSGELVIFRDITKEKRIAKSNEAMLRISMALPEYPDLEELLDYISGEIKRLLETQGALVILLDDEKKEFFFPGAAYDDNVTKMKIKQIRLPIDSMASGEVVKTGKPLIVNDAYKDSELYFQRDKEFGYSFDNYVLVPIKNSDRIIGVLAAFNKTEGDFEQADMELLGMVAGTVGLSIENARFSDELKKSHRELLSLDRAKSKAINHLSHELKTPVAIFNGTLDILSKKLKSMPDDTWRRSMDRAKRNIERIKQLQNEINDIIFEKEHESKSFLNYYVNQCADLLDNIIENELEETHLIDRVRSRIDKIFMINKSDPENILLNDFVKHRFETLQPKFAHRRLKVDLILDSARSISIAAEPLQKIIDGLIKNAVENTPDHGKIEITVSKHESGASLVIKDYGIGIIVDDRHRIFEGFFTTQETAVYSSKKPFDFNAGGRGADLLRMKIFSERYNFSIDAFSNRCKFIPGKDDICPGDVDNCIFCTDENDCYQSGESVFTVNFKSLT
ncbi:MAG: GAF domain-containing protein [Desulfobacteraceae bacterium]|nr:GAF domain-containing protein [Desulfobacteraceae bacterium]